MLTIFGDTIMMDSDNFARVEHFCTLDSLRQLLETIETRAENLKSFGTKDMEKLGAGVDIAVSIIKSYMNGTVDMFPLTKEFDENCDAILSFIENASEKIISKKESLIQ